MLLRKLADMTRIQPRPAAPPPPPANDAAAEAFINGAAVVPPQAQPPQPVIKKRLGPPPKQDKVLLRIPSVELWDQIEAARAKGAFKMNRNTWILQAIAEKLERDS